MEDDILNWNPKDWSVEGADWMMIEEEEDTVCKQGETYIVAIAAKIGFH